MLLLQQITTFLLLEEATPLSLNWKIELLDLMSHSATKPFSLAEAKICATSLFHDTDVT